METKYILSNWGILYSP